MDHDSSLEMTRLSGLRQVESIDLVLWFVFYDVTVCNEYDLVLMAMPFSYANVAYSVNPVSRVCVE